MKTAIMTDTNSGITKQEAADSDIFLMPMPIIIDEEIYYEGVNLTEESFYKDLTDGRDISTSQPSPGDVMDMWKQILSSGYDEVVYIPMSSGLSNSCESAIGLSKEFDGKVMVADNHRISVTMRESVFEAKRLADSGLCASDIKDYLEKTAFDASIYIAVDTLEFLKKGGRITPAAAALGAVLNIKPILSIQGEKLDAFAKVRGIKKCKAKMIEALQNDLNTRFKNVDKSRIRFWTAGTALSPEEVEEWKSAVSEAFNGADVNYNPLSLSIGTHTGPGAMGIGLVVVAK
ncbi:MAG: DegV family protein [Lachnospiraceae bacterium]|nr:DegV family protein [Lachnospiraceae bacterium]